MSTYLKFFELEQSPFEAGEGATQVVLGTRALRDALATIETGLEDGIERICVSGGPGLGKTSLARALPKLLGDATRVAIVLDPTVGWESARRSIARQWELPGGGLPRAGLVEAARSERLVLVVDAAETATEEFLDHLDVLLSYRGEDARPVVQSVLLAQLSGGERPSPAPLLWWLDRIQTLQLEFAPLPREGIGSYIHKHLKRAGWRGPRLFEPEAALAVHGYTGGIPGEVSRLCERLLAEAAERGLHSIDEAFVHAICDESSEAEEAPAGGDFEELVLDDEIARNSAADPMPTAAIDLVDAVTDREPSESLAETLERFDTLGPSPSSSANDDLDQDADGTGSPDELGAWQTDPEADPTARASARAPLGALDAILSAPASLAELRAIRGTLLARHARPLAAAAAAAIVGGLLLAWIMGGAAPTPPDVDDPSIGERIAADAIPAADSDTGATPAARPLARLRGPVQDGMPIETRPGAAPSGSGTVSRSLSRRTASRPIARAAPVRPAPDQRGTDLDDDLDGPIDEDDLVDLRPAAMRPGAGSE
jgi:type II secretory pathway predicted ATPase ExeA